MSILIRGGGVVPPLTNLALTRLSTYIAQLLSSGQLSFTSQPQSKAVDQYSLATFSCVILGGVGPYTYQWKKNGINVGTNSDSLSFVAATTDKNASITVTVTDSVGTIITSSAAILGVTSYVYQLDGVAQYHKLSNQIPFDANTVIKIKFLGVPSFSGAYRKFIESADYATRVDSNASGNTFRLNSCTAKLDGIAISTGTAIPTSGWHTLEITPTSTSSLATIGSRGSGELSIWGLFGFEVIKSGVISNNIPLNNKSAGANQLATAGSINATIVNYNPAGWVAL